MNQADDRSLSRSIAAGAGGAAALGDERAVFGFRSGLGKVIDRRLGSWNF
jgi:hypothetical protein